MKNLLKNKKALIPIIIGVVIIIVAIIIFIIIGNSSKSQSRNVIKLDNTQADTSNSTTNITNDTTENTSDNETENDTNTANTTDDNTTGGDEIDFSGDEFYLSAAQDFVEGLTDSDKMDTFVENHLDVKAYAASYNVNGDDAKFMDEYSSLSDDDSEASSVEEKLLELATEDDAILTDLTEPKQSSDDEKITRVTLSVKIGDETVKYRMVFYQDLVIYINDANGDSIIDLES